MTLFTNKVSLYDINIHCIVISCTGYLPKDDNSHTSTIVDAW